jgi:hypothetical protein
MQNRSPSAALALALVIGLAMHAVVEGVDVRVEHDKTFSFKNVRSWGWNPKAPGKVIMARTEFDDPEAAQRQVEPWILDAVPAEMTRRGLQGPVGTPDLTLSYYLLLSTSMSTQTMGQFLPATTAWGLPPFAQATQSLEMMNKGSLVLDLSAGGNVVWRGVAEARVDMDADDKKREKLVREAIRSLLRRYPPK